MEVAETPRSCFVARAGLRAGLLAVVAAGGVACAGEPPGRVEASADDAEAAVETFIAAWEAEDVQAVLDAFTADAVAVDPVPPGRFEGTEGIREWVTADFEALDEISIALEDVQVRTEGAVAWLTGRYVFEARFEDGAFRNEGFVSMVWVRQPDGTYLMPLFHASPLPQAAPVSEAAPAPGGGG